MGYIDLKIDIKIASRKAIEMRTKSLNLENNPSSSNSMQQMESNTTAGADQSMDLELYLAVKQDVVDDFISALERVSREKQQPLSSIFKQLSPMGNTFLHVAASCWGVEMVAFIASHSPLLIKTQNSEGDTALHLAAKAGCDDSIRTFRHLQKDFADAIVVPNHSGRESEREVNLVDLVYGLQNEKGNTALHEALMNGHEYIAWLLIDAAPEVSNYLNNEGKSALYLAAEAGYVDTVQRILSVHIEDENPDERLKGKSPIYAAILTRNRDVLDALLELEPRFIQLADEKGRTPLHWAASLGHLEEVQYFLEKYPRGAFARDKNGLFPIHLASIKGHVDVVRVLLECWPDVGELLNYYGQNILHVAAKNGRHNMVRYILDTPELEGLINAKEKHGNTPLHLATMNWHPSVVSTLTWDVRVDLKLVNNEGMTALDSAEYYMNRTPSFRKRLTWTALKAGGTPKSYRKRNFNGNETQTYVQQEHPTMDNYKDRVNTLLLVATLVATVTFAAGFTMPGGYSNSTEDQGTAVMLKHRWFHVFIFCDTMAMYSSIIVAVSLIWAQLGDLYLVLTAFRVALPLLGIALITMSLAFTAGLYLVISTLNWLANAVLVTCLVFLTMVVSFFFPLCFPVSSNYSILRYISYYPYHLLIFITRSYTSNDDLE